MFTMSPPICCFLMTETACCESKNWPFTNTSCKISQSPNVVSSNDLEMESPAQLTRISTPPKARVVSRRAFPMAVVSVTSTFTVRTASLVYLAASSVWVSSSKSRSAATTQAPFCSSNSQMALPMPPVPPVTKATLPESGLGLGIRRNFASSSSQYSMSKASCSASPWYSEMASAPRITLMALV